jgi:hypothetical protein
MSHHSIVCVLVYPVVGLVETLEKVCLLFHLSIGPIVRLFHRSIDPVVSSVHRSIDSIVPSFLVYLVFVFIES